MPQPLRDPFPAFPTAAGDHSIRPLIASTALFTPDLITKVPRVMPIG